GADSDRGRLEQVSPYPLSRLVRLDSYEARRDAEAEGLNFVPNFKAAGQRITVSLSVDGATNVTHGTKGAQASVFASYLRRVLNPIKFQSGSASHEKWSYRFI